MWVKRREWCAAMSIRSSVQWSSQHALYRGTFAQYVRSNSVNLRFAKPPTPLYPTYALKRPAIYFGLNLVHDIIMSSNCFAFPPDEAYG